MNEVWGNHIQRLKSGVSQERSLAEVPRWIERNTTMSGRPFSFSGHRYQLGILQDPSPNLCVTKPSQVGASEMVARMILARSAIMQPYNAIYCMPSAKAAQDFCKGRVNQVIEGSPYLREMVSRENDSVTMKQIGYSMIHFKGAFKDAQAISVNADVIIADEYSYCDTTIVKQFNSRLTHSKYKHMIYFSTPLLPGLGIDAEIGESRRHYRMCKCVHCGEWFWPDFLKHCRIPGHDVDWLSVTRHQLSLVPWQETKIFCPNCGLEPDLSHEHRAWVLENTDASYISAGYVVSPFDVPSIIKPAYLAEKSVAYNRKIDWMNVNLGMAAEDKESTILRSELEAVLIDSVGSGGVFVLGLDLGMTCHAVVKLVLPDGVSVTVHTEQIPVGRLFERYFELRSQWRIRVSVADFYPYSETILRMQTRDPGLFSAIYVTARSTEPYVIKQTEKDKEAGKEEIRRVSINRDIAFDMLMFGVRNKSLLKRRDENDDLWVKHMLSMKRVRAFGPNDEMVYQWRKTDGEDHFAHAEVYATVASRMVGMHIQGAGGMLPLVSSFKVKSAGAE